MADHIKIGDISPRIQYVGDGLQMVFTYPFPIFADADIWVYIDDIPQTITTHYSVTGAGTDTGGTITFVTAPPALQVVTLVRNLVVKRESDFQESGEFRAKVINDELDKIIAMVQEIEDELGRGLFLSATDTASSLTLPVLANRANGYLAFDASGNPIAATIPGTYPASTFMGTVLDDADGAAARTTLGLAIGTDVLSPTGDGSGLTGITGGGPSIGIDSIIRTNAKNVIENITLSDHSATFTADAGGDTMSRGTDDGYANGDTVYVSSTTTLPAGLAAATEYYVVGVAAATMQLAATFGGAAIDITDAGTGTHTVYQAINGISAGPVTVETGFTVTVPTGSTWSVV